jgi:hypothetical protein
VKYQILHQYKTTGTIINPYILIVVYLESSQEEKISWAETPKTLS